MYHTAGVVLLGIGFLLAQQIITIYYNRLILHNLPAREVIVSSFLPVGPTAMTALGLMNLALAADHHLIPFMHTQEVQVPLDDKCKGVLLQHISNCPAQLRTGVASPTVLCILEIALKSTTQVAACRCWPVLFVLRITQGVSGAQSQVDLPVCLLPAGSSHTQGSHK